MDSGDDLFGDNGSDNGRDPPITEKDILRRQREKQNKTNKKSSREIEEIKKQQHKKKMEEAKRGKWEKKKKTDIIIRTDEEEKTINANQTNQQQQPVEESKTSKKEFAIYNDIQDDENFQAFINRFITLKEKAHSEGKQVVQMPKEDDYGNIEYKLKLANPSIERVEHLTTQMKFRLGEGNGQAFYYIGVEDNGNALGLDNEEMLEALGTLFFMARNLNAEILVTNVLRGIQGDIAEVQVQKNEIEGIKIDIKITMLGGEGAGKSTLIGVLISGKKDNGKGQARTNVFRHKHEILDGRTSSVSQQILGFDSQGKVTNQSKFGLLTWAQIVEQSQKILTFIDVAGNEKYAKTMIRGICCHYPDYALIVVDAKAGLTQITRDHFKLSFAFNVPVIIVITKIDLVKQDTLIDIMQDIGELLKEFSQKIPVIVREERDVVLFSRTIQEEPICPVFQVSNKTGQGLDLFLGFLNLLPINNNIQQWKENLKDSPEFHITETFDKDGEQILSGMIVRGSISLRQQLLLGPDNDGRFRKVEIKGIHCKRVPVRQVKAGQMCSFAINLGTFAENWIKNCGGEIRKGMVLLDPKTKPAATWTFIAEIWTFDGTTKTIKNNYQPVVHTAHIRQSAKIIYDKSINLDAHEISTNIGSTSVDDHNKSNPTSSEEEEKKSPSVQLGNKSKRNQSNSVSPQCKQKRDIKHALANPEQEEIVISPNKKTKLIFQFLYTPEYVNKDSYLIINENNLKAFGRIIDVYYDTLSKYGSNTNQIKQKRKSSVPSQNYTTLHLQEIHRSFDSENDNPMTRQTQQQQQLQVKKITSHSMCIEESQEEEFMKSIEKDVEKMQINQQQQ